MDGAGWDHVTTFGYRPHDRLSRWTAWAQRVFGGMHVEPGDRQGFAAEASCTDFGPACLTVMDFTPAHAVKCRPDTGNAADDALVFSLPQYGSFTYFDEGRGPVRVGPGDIYIRDLSRPWSLSTEGRSGLITLRLPFAALAERFEDPQGLAGQRVAGDRPEAACLGGVLRSTLAMLESGPGRAQREVLARTILDALQLLDPGPCAGPGGRPAPADQVILRRRAVLEIARNLGDPELGPAGVARALGVGPHHLQRAFQGAGQTLQGVILDQRLDRAATILRDARGTGRPRITTLAMELGFNDPAYFSRAFRRRFGAAPSRFPPGRPPTR